MSSNVDINTKYVTDNSFLIIFKNQQGSLGVPILQVVNNESKIIV